jgi:hypothetical protein
MATTRAIRRGHSPDGGIWWLRMKPRCATSGNVHRAVSPRRNGHQNRRRLGYIFYIADYKIIIYSFMFTIYLNCFNRALAQSLVSVTLVLDWVQLSYSHC